METFDVIAINQESHEERTLASDKTRTNADAIIKMAVYRRGVEVEFFKKVPHKDRREQ